MEDENSLAHYGVKGMRWGKRKASSKSSDDDGEMTTSEANKALGKAVAKQLLIGAAVIGARVAINKGARWVLQNPDKVAVFMQRAENARKGVKAIGVGYEVIKI